jgi:hypothetical protein
MHVKLRNEPVRLENQDDWEAAARVNPSRVFVPLSGEAAGSLCLRWP